MVLNRLVFLIFLSIIGFACDKQEDYNFDPDFRFTFSTDILSFDTLFTGFTSTTKQLKIYNPSSKAVKISSIKLNKTATAYRLNVNGNQSNLIQNIELSARDSLYVFVEVDLAQANEDAPRLLSDKIVVEANGHVQEIVLETFAQDVYVIEEDIVEQTTWTENRPYLVLKPIWIEEGIELMIQNGARIYFAKNAGLHIKGRIAVNGTFEQGVFFGSTRLEDLYENTPGQWDGIYFYKESSASLLRHFVLENGINGLSFDGISTNSPVDLSYGIVRNFTKKGIAAKNTTILAHDLVISNCGQECFKLEGDATCEIYQSTFYNFWPFSLRNQAIVSFHGSGEAKLKISNSIVWGTRNNEIRLEPFEAVEIRNTLLKLSDIAQTDYAAVFENCIFNTNPLFIDIDTFNFELQAESPAVDKGNAELNKENWVDFKGHTRNLNETDMGAYEYIKIN